MQQEHFNHVLAQSPDLAGAISYALVRCLRSATKAQFKAEQNLDHWRQQVLDSIELDLPPAEEQAMLQRVVKSSAPLAILIGTLTDNIPESTGIGITAGDSYFSGSLSRL